MSRITFDLDSSDMGEGSRPAVPVDATAEDILQMQDRINSRLVARSKRGEFSVVNLDGTDACMAGVWYSSSTRTWMGVAMSGEALHHIEFDGPPPKEALGEGDA